VSKAAHCKSSNFFIFNSVTQHIQSSIVCFPVSFPSSPSISGFPKAVTVYFFFKYKKVKCSHYRPGVTQRVGRGIALLFHDRGTRTGWVVSSTPWPHFTPGKDPVPILQEAGWAPGPVWTGGISRPNQDLIPNLAARSQSLYRLNYRAHIFPNINLYKSRQSVIIRHEWRH